MNIYFEKLPYKRESLFGRLLALELGVFGDHVLLPLDLAGGQVPHHLRDVAQRDPNLAGRVPLPECNGVGLKAVEVDGDAERDGDLVGARVAPPDGAGRVVHLVTNLRRRQLDRELLDDGVEVRVVGEGEHGALDGRHERREGEVGPLLVPLPDDEVVLEEAVHDAADAERGLDHARYHLLYVNFALEPLHFGDHVFGDAEGLVFNIDVVAAFLFHRLLQLLNLIRCKSPKVFGDILCILLERLPDGSLVQYQFDDV